MTRRNDNHIRSSKSITNQSGRRTTPNYLFLMHNDTTTTGNESLANAWAPYLAALRASGNFEGGSAIGTGLCMRKYGAIPSVTRHLTGYIRISANNL